MKRTLVWIAGLVACAVLSLTVFLPDVGAAEGQLTATAQAVQYVSQRYAIPMSRLKVLTSFSLMNAATEENATAVTIADNKTYGKAFKVVVNPSGSVMERTEYEQILDKTYRGKYGKLSPDLYDVLQSKSSDEKVKVAVWLKCDVNAIAANVSAKYPQAKLAGLRPTIETDPTLYQSIKLDLDDALRRGYRDVEDQITQSFTAKGFSVSGRCEYAPAVLAEVPKSVVLDIAQQDGVDTIYDVSGNLIPALDIAAQAIMTPRQGTFGSLTGSGVRVAVVDYEGIDFGNPYLTTTDAGIRRSGFSYVTYNDNPRFQGHATKTAGVIAGSNDPSPYKGIAPGVMLVSANGAFGDQDIAPAADWAISPSYGNADILNLSLGVYTDATKGQIQFLDRYFDNVVVNHGKTVVVAAGNGGIDDPQHDTELWVKSPGLAYNVITVGNYDDHNTPGWNDDTIYSTSCFKDPSGGDRNKPEVAAPGTNVMTTSAMADPSHPITAVPGVTGTSFAAPMVAGETARLMQQSLPMKWWPEAVKAVIMTSAYHDVDPSSRDKDGVGGIDVQYAHEIVQNGTWSEGSFYPGSDTNTYRYLNATVGQKVRAVVTWSAHPNSQDPDFYYSHSLLDIDLEVLGPDGQPVPGAYSASWNNNYEAVEFTAPSSGTYTLHAYYYQPISEIENYAITWDARKVPILTTSTTLGGTVTAPGIGSFGPYDIGAVVNLVATPYSGFVFDRWLGDTGTIGNIGLANTTIAMNGGYAVQASFVPNTHYLTVTSGGGGTVNNPGIGTFGPYNNGEYVALWATPNSGYHFVNWTGQTGTVTNPNSASTSVCMLGNYSIQATFAPDSYTLTMGSGAGGTVTTPGLGTFGPYSAGTVVNLVATPNATYHFVNWTGNTGTIANPNAASTSITMNGNYSIQANFAPDSPPPPTPPSVTTNSASGVTSTSATLNGSLASLGTATSVAVSFEYGLTTSYGSAITASPSPMTSPGSFTASLTNLTPNTTYHFRAKGDGGSAGTGYGGDQVFTTSASGPTVIISINTSSPSGPTVIIFINTQ